MTPHLKGHVRAYVDRALPPAMLHLYDKHLVCCTVCRAAADQERRIVAALRAETGVPMSLRSSLMGLAAASPADEPMGTQRIPPVPTRSRMPSAPLHEPVPTVPPTAPALHRSPMRAAVVASIAAGASVAAAWGLAVSPAPGARLPSVRGPVANFGGSTASAASAVSFGGSALPAERVTPAARGDRRAGDLGSAVLPYWVVSTRSTGSSGRLGPVAGPDIVSGVVDSVRITTVRSAQSTP